MTVDWGSIDHPTVDQSSVDSAPPDAASSCLPEDAATTCDLLALTGCSTGAGCYLVQGAYLDCVCPAGTVGVGGACTTTVQCQPGLGCVGDSPPGVCRQVCDPSAPACATGLTCKPAALMPQYGMCVP